MGTGSVRREWLDLGAPTISSVRLSPSACRATRWAVRQTDSVPPSKSTSRHFSAQTSPSRIPAYSPSSAGSSFHSSAALRSLSCSSRLSTRWGAHSPLGSRCFRQGFCAISPASCAAFIPAGSSRSTPRTVPSDSPCSRRPSASSCTTPGVICVSASGASIGSRCRSWYLYV